jgi:hypothetical protein
MKSVIRPISILSAVANSYGLSVYVVLSVSSLLILDPLLAKLTISEFIEKKLFTPYKCSCSVAFEDHDSVVFGLPSTSQVVRYFFVDRLDSVKFIGGGVAVRLELPLISVG